MARPMAPALVKVTLRRLLQWMFGKRIVIDEGIVIVASMATACFLMNVASRTLPLRTSRSQRSRMVRTERATSVCTGRLAKKYARKG